MNKDEEWFQIQRQLPKGTIIWCEVKSHEPFGMFVKIPSVTFRGLIQVTDVSDDKRITMADYPPIETKLQAVVLGFQLPGYNIWLGTKPSQFAKCSMHKNTE